MLMSTFPAIGWSSSLGQAVPARAAWRSIRSMPRGSGSILPLPLGIERIERQAALAGTAWPSDDDQPIAGNVDINILEIVHSRPANANHLWRRCSDTWLTRQFQLA